MSDTSKYLPKLLGPHSITQDGGDEVTARPTWDFVGFTLTDDDANDKTVFTVAGSATPTGTGLVTVTSSAFDAASRPVGSGFYTFAATPSSSNLAALVTDETGTGLLTFATMPSFSCSGGVAFKAWNSAGTFRYHIAPSNIVADRILSLPFLSADDTLVSLAASQALSNKTISGASNTLTVRIASDVTGLGTGVATFLTTPSSANLISAVTDETGTGALVFGTSPVLSSPTITGSIALSGTSAFTTADAKGTERDTFPVHVQTSDATVTTLDSFTIASSSAVAVTWLVTAFKTDLSQAAGYSVAAVFRNNAGAVSQTGTTTVTVLGEDDSVWDCTIDNSTTTIRLRVTGKVTTTIQWTAIMTSLTVIP